ncbi:glycosyltransferase family 4 protein [Methylotuvimicrobium sp. KM2]|uniref:glycosyltransferase family 4 protein n=1 Tax=Methylotuvimicrobium sp. KM2 TaxID=3133976 RepID=UPI0031013844
MKTLHLFHHSNLKNGVDKTTCTLIVALKKLGVEPIAVVPEAGEVTDYLDAQGIVFRIIPYSCCLSHAERAQLRFLADSYDRQEALLSFIAEQSPDLIHINTAHLLHAGLAAAQLRIPTVWHIHSPFDEDLKRYRPLIGQGGYIWLLERLSSHLLGVSDDVKRTLAEFLPVERITTLYNGIDIDELTRAAQNEDGDLRQALNCPADAKLILGVGRISAQKDFAAFARVAARVIETQPDAFFIIAGPRQESEAVDLLEQEITRLQLSDRVLMLGPRGDVPNLCAQSDVFLSTAIFEGQGIAALEAMAFKKPVVAMACQGLRECIRHEHDGLLVEPGDEAGAADAIVRVLDNPEFAAELGNNGRQSVAAHFSSDQYARQFLAVAESAIAYGPARITEHEFELLQGLLKQIHYAHTRLSGFEQQTLMQRLKLLLWQGFHHFKSR